MNEQELIALLRQMNGNQSVPQQFDLSQDVGSITPTQLTPSQQRVQGLANLLQTLGQRNVPLFSTFKNPRQAYQLADQLTFLDPFKQGGVGEYLPGFSYELAKERNDPLGQGLSLLDIVPGGGLIAAPLKEGAKKATQAIADSGARRLLTRGQADLYTGDVVLDALNMHKRAVRLGPEFNQQIDTIAENLGLTTTLPGTTRQIDRLTGSPIGTVKMPERIAEKAATKTGADVTNITDPIRTRIIVKTPEEEEQAVKALKEQYKVFDKGRDIKPEGFADRKLNIEFTGANGETLIGEVGVITEPMWRASDKAHSFYEEFRSLLPKGMPANASERQAINADVLKKAKALQKEMNKIFKEAKDQIDPSFYD